MNKHFTLPKDELFDFCRRRKITELALFGSVLGDDFGPNSDIDLLVSFHPDAKYTLFDLVHIQEKLSNIFNREVDLVERQAIERSRNPLRRKAILDTAETVYEA